MESSAETPPDAGIRWIEAPGHSPGRVRPTAGNVIAVLLLVAIAAVLGTLVIQANRQPATSAGPDPAPPPAAVPVPSVPSAVPIPLIPAGVPSAGVPSATVSPAAPATPRRTARTTPDRRATATFEVTAPDSSVTVRSGDLGTDLYRVSLAGNDPQVTANVDADHRLTVVNERGGAAPPVTITLTSAIRWNLKLSAGNSQITADLTRSRLASVELAGGANDFRLALPAASGTLPVRVTRGMNQLTITTNGVPVRATLRSGAGDTVLDGDHRGAAKPGTVLTSGGRPDATDRVDVDVVAGLGRLTLQTH